MLKTLRPIIAEVVGVFLIVFLSGAACAALPLDESGKPRDDSWATVVAALAAGCAVAVVLPIAFRESPGCLNPAVTLTLWVCKRLETRFMSVLIGAQALGSLLAGLAILAIFPNEKAIAFATPHVGNTLLDQTGTNLPLILLAGIAVEALLTFFLTFAIFGLLIDRRTQRFGGVAVGLAQTAIVLVGYRLTGGCANPARWFGPYVWQFSVEQLRIHKEKYLFDHPVYWIGPILGAVAAGMLYTTYILPRDQAKEGRA
jgi:glycerol uptake facilitator-like aquaporin